MYFPDTSIMHKVEIEIKYGGQKEGSNTPVSEEDVNLGEENNEVEDTSQAEDEEGTEEQTGDTIDEGFVEEEEEEEKQGKDSR